ncbi:MAG: hypothetical protein LC687_00045 [Actinobacteria bacterium]|nr:hypothetical protein [Actinomycetota bacterium]
MAQHIHSRTIHTISIDLQDDVLAKIEAGDEVEVVLQGRSGASRPKKLTFGDLRDLLSDSPRVSGFTKARR